MYAFDARVCVYTYVYVSVYVGVLCLCTCACISACKERERVCVCVCVCVDVRAISGPRDMHHNKSDEKGENTRHMPAPPAEQV